MQYQGETYKIIGWISKIYALQIQRCTAQDFDRLYRVRAETCHVWEQLHSVDKEVCAWWSFTFGSSDDESLAKGQH